MNEQDYKLKMQNLSLYSTDELQDELNRRYEANEKTDEINRIITLNINGVTVKDFQVGYYESVSGWNRHDLPNLKYNYSLYIKYKGKSYDIYYDGEKLWKKEKFWPVYQIELMEGESLEDFDFYNIDASREFVPYFFREACENCYESDYDLEKTIELLKEMGFEDIFNVDEVE